MAVRRGGEGRAVQIIRLHRYHKLRFGGPRANAKNSFFPIGHTVCTLLSYNSPAEPAVEIIQLWVPLVHISRRWFNRGQSSLCSPRVLISITAAECQPNHESLPPFGGHNPTPPADYEARTFDRLESSLEFRGGRVRFGRGWYLEGRRL